MSKQETQEQEESEQEIQKLFDSAEITEKAEDGSFTAIASTPRVDRHGEVVDISGWDLKNFKKNPVLLWAHDHTIPAIGKASRIWTSDGKLMFKGVWSTATEYGRAAKQLVAEGILNSFSVSFLPREMDGDTYTKQELLEISLVNVPANPDAMILAYKSLTKSGFEKKLIKGIGIPAELLDKFDSMEKDIATLQEKFESLAKVEAPAAPQTRVSKVLTKSQRLTKVILRAADQQLVGEKKGIARERRVELSKIIKRAGEKLSATHKEQLHGKDS